VLTHQPSSFNDHGLLLPWAYLGIHFTTPDLRYAHSELLGSLLLPPFLLAKYQTTRVVHSMLSQYTALDTKGAPCSMSPDNAAHGAASHCTDPRENHNILNPPQTTNQVTGNMSSTSNRSNIRAKPLRVMQHASRSPSFRQAMRYVPCLTSKLSQNSIVRRFALSRHNVLHRRTTCNNCSGTFCPAIRGLLVDSSGSRLRCTLPPSVHTH
jgi:hypothetical protein